MPGLRAAGITNMQQAPGQAAAVAVEVEPGPNNSRRVYAGVSIAAPWASVWGALTDYDGLGDFIPGTIASQPVRLLMLSHLFAMLHDVLPESVVLLLCKQRWR